MNTQTIEIKTIEVSTQCEHENLERIHSKKTSLLKKVTTHRLKIVLRILDLLNFLI